MDAPAARASRVRNGQVRQRVRSDAGPDVPLAGDDWAQHATVGDASGRPRTQENGLPGKPRVSRVRGIGALSRRDAADLQGCPLEAAARTLARLRLAASS